MNLGTVGGIHRKVNRMLRSLKKEWDDMTRELDNVVSIVLGHTERAERSVEKLANCSEGDLKKTYQQVSKELDRMDEEITIIGVTMNLEFTDDEIDVVDRDFKDNAGRRTSSRYFFRKIQGRLWRLQRDIQILTSEVHKLKHSVHQRVIESEKTADRIFEVGDDLGEENVLKLFKEFSTCHGLADTEITMLRVSLPNPGDFSFSHQQEIVIHSLVNENQNAEKEERIATATSISRTDEIVDNTEVINNDSIFGKSTNPEEQVKIAKADVSLEKSRKELINEDNTSFDITELNSPKENLDSLTGGGSKSLDKPSTNLENKTKKEKQKQELNRKITKSTKIKENLSSNSKSGSKTDSLAIKSQSCKIGKLNNSNAVPISIVETQRLRRQQLDMVRNKLEEYGEPLMVGEYNKFMMTFDSGCPAKFWIFANTEALWELQSFIQVSGVEK